jgi:hypothetical protein
MRRTSNLNIPVLDNADVSACVNGHPMAQGEKFCGKCGAPRVDDVPPVGPEQTTISQVGDARPKTSSLDRRTTLIGGLVILIVIGGVVTGILVASAGGGTSTRSSGSATTTTVPTPTSSTAPPTTTSTTSTIAASAPPATSGLWTAAQLIITANSLGAVQVGMTLGQAQTAAGLTFDGAGDGMYYPTSLTDHLYVGVLSGTTVSCVGVSKSQSAESQQTIATPDGFQLGGSVQSLLTIYGSSAKYVPGTVGIQDS